MTTLIHDLQHKAAEAARLPSVDDWIAAGGQVEVVTDAPRLSAVMVQHTDRELAA